MISGIKTGALEYNPHRLEYLLQCLLATLRAAHQGMLAERLLFLELHSAIIALVDINWHNHLPLLNSYNINLAGYYSAPVGERQGQGLPDSKIIIILLQI